MYTRTSCQGFVDTVYSLPMFSRPQPVRIGEFGRRVGVAPELLRAWERRYGLLRPIRSPGGFRLYTPEDAERVSRMRQALEQGVSAAEAARAALDDGQPSEGLLEDAAARLLGAIERYDETAAHTLLDETLAAFGLDTVLREVILPTLEQVGRGWENGTLEIGHEHFASNLIRGRLLSLARLWSRGGGPLAVLACPPGEAHDISLLAFGLLVRSHGWRILFLGADTPVPTLTQTAKTTQATLTVLTIFNPAVLEPEATELRHLARLAPLALSGPGASDTVCNQLGARLLDDDLFQAADAVARTMG